MNIVTDIRQGTEEWKQLRVGKITASNFSKIVTGTGKQSKQAMQYGYQLAAEHITGTPTEVPETYWMNRGKTLEPSAKRYFEFQTNMEIQDVGFVLHSEHKLIGCSPDGLLDDGSGIEIKCPCPANHIANIDCSGLPEKYKAQVQGTMWICEADYWWFISYSDVITPAIKKVYRDNDYIDNLSSSILDFNEWYMELLEKLNNENIRGT